MIDQEINKIIAKFYQWKSNLKGKKNAIFVLFHIDPKNDPKLRL